MGRYSEMIQCIEKECEYNGNRKSLEVSLKVLDILDQSTNSLPVKQAITILDDAKNVLLQLVGIN